MRAVEGKFTSKKWKEISKEFQSHGFVRSQVEIREKWVNELNPKLRKTNWAEDELALIF